LLPACLRTQGLAPYEKGTIWATIVFDKVNVNRRDDDIVKPNLADQTNAINAALAVLADAEAQDLLKLGTKDKPLLPPTLPPPPNPGILHDQSDAGV
jgi:hypothetical protein